MTRQIAYCAATLHMLWARGDSYQEIAAALGCSESYVHRLKVRHKLSQRQKPTREIFEDDPTPEQIDERKAAIRARNLEALRNENPDASRSRAARASNQVSESIRCYSWDGFRFSDV